MKKKAFFVVGATAVALGAFGYLSGQQPAGKKAKENSADVAAIKKAGQSFLKAYLAGDAKAMASHWTESGEYHADGGKVVRGRAEIEKLYAEQFAKKTPYTDASFDVTSIRFPSKDTAIEEGYFKVRKEKEAPVTSKYSVLHVREGDKWLMAVVHDYPDEAVSLRDLEWLIGTWEAKRDDIVVRTTFEWWGNNGFIRSKITIKTKDKAREGFQMIGRDASTGNLRSWTFDTHGEFGEATWTRDGKKWMQDSASVLHDGSILAATNILTWIDNDTFTFQSVERSIGGEAVPDVPPVRVTRVKSK
ncbi:MAG TPA: SgcJ/EcaC family oxidoreductase [Gemmataceae bacterium]|nr:SgcJ/EcaC family oxidoreductase [Gemmataceae bacterium]